MAGSAGRCRCLPPARAQLSGARCAGSSVLGLDSERRRVSLRPLTESLGPVLPERTGIAKTALPLAAGLDVAGSFATAVAAAATRRRTGTPDTRPPGPSQPPSPRRRRAGPGGTIPGPAAPVAAAAAGGLSLC